MFQDLSHRTTFLKPVHLEKTWTHKRK